jgi:hypothetical protein
MSDWSQPKQLVELAAFYRKAESDPDSISDTEFIENISKAHWATNCWSFAKASFAIISPGCALRPHLVRQLIRIPIQAMMAGGLEDPELIITQGIAYANNPSYVDPTPEGKQWLINEWPKIENVAKEVFQEIQEEEMNDDDFD